MVFNNDPSTIALPITNHLWLKDSNDGVGANKILLVCPFTGLLSTLIFFYIFNSILTSTSLNTTSLLLNLIKCLFAPIKQILCRIGSVLKIGILIELNRQDLVVWNQRLVEKFSQNWNGNFFAESKIHIELKSETGTRISRFFSSWKSEPVPELEVQNSRNRTKIGNRDPK